MTYGLLIGEAKRLLSRSLNSPITLPTTSDALLACDARTRLYRVIAGGIALHLPQRTGPHASLLPGHNGPGIRRAEVALLAQLRADLLDSATTTSHTTPAAPTHPAAVTNRLAQAADLAGAAFDLLAGHLHPRQPAAPSTRSPEPLDSAGVRVTARDAVQLARAMTQLDRRLELPIRSAARPDLDGPARQRLIAVADDCARVVHQGVGELATTAHWQLRHPARDAVDGLDIRAPHASLPGSRYRPESAVTMVGELLAAARRPPQQFGVADLAAITSVGARACVLTAYACTPVGGPVGQALEAARQWRRIFQHLAPFATASAGCGLAVYDHQFRRYADPLIRHGSQARFAHPTWLPAVQTVTTQLASLAQSLTRTIAVKLAAGELLVPFDPHTRGREHLYAAANPSDHRATELQQAASLTHDGLRNLVDALRSNGLSTDDREARTPQTSVRTPAKSRAVAPPKHPPPPGRPAPRVPRR